MISLEDNSWVNDKLVGETDIEKDAEQADIKELIGNCIDDLPLIYRSPLSLYFQEEKTYAEISDIMRVPVNTVGTRIARGKKLLKNIYKKEAKNND